ncbi:MAG: hypothetical protein QNJ55_08100 [Xenococcus sp. MO_188.B8]|nr:hypothetical protein [Xenococcus sp. MO_188.B8]
MSEVEVLPLTKVIFGKEYTIDVGAHRDAPLQVSDKSDQNLVKIFREIT